MRICPPLLVVVIGLCGTGRLWAEEFADSAMRADGVGEAWEALQAGHYAEAVPQVKHLAEEQNRHALLWLALMQFTGAGVPLDQDQAMETLRTAASRGNATAARELLNDAEKGQTDFGRWRAYANREEFRTPKLPDALAYEVDGRLHLRIRPAIAWNQAQAATGDATALYNLARYVELAPNLVGRGREDQDELLREALEAGSREALREFQTGDVYATLREEDPDFAAKVFKLSFQTATEDDADSQFFLGRLGVAEAQSESEYQLAMGWLMGAANQYHTEAKALLEVELDSPRTWTEESGDHRAATDPFGTAAGRAQTILHQLLGETDVDVIFAALLELDSLSRENDAALVAMGDALIRYPQVAWEGDYLERLERAQAAGNLPAGNRLGLLWVRGRVDLDARPDHGRWLLEELARQGDLKSQMDLYYEALRSDGPLFDPSQATRYRVEFSNSHPAFELVLKRMQAKRREEAFAQTPIPSGEALERLQAAHRGRGSTAEPVPVFQCKPVFPSEQRANQIVGQAIVSFVVDTTGRPRELRVVRATVPAFGEEAMAAVERWRFAPGLKNGRVVNTRMQVPIVFNIVDE